MKYCKDVLIYGAITIGLIVIGRATFKDVGNAELLNELSSYVGTVVVILFGILGIFDFAYTNGIKFLVPNSYENFVLKKEKKIVSHCIDDFIKQEFGYLNQYGNTRISFFLEQLGLTQNDFQKLKSHMISIKLMPLHDIEQAKDKLMKIIFTPGVIICQNKLESNRLVYKKVNYYINLLNVMYLDNLSKELADCMSMLIADKLDANELLSTNKIIVPYNGNYLLGLETSKILGKSIINVTKEPKIFVDEHWVGNFDGNSNVGIIVLDVLVTGDQVIESIGRVNTHCYIKHIFCLVNRLDQSGKESLEKMGYEVHSLLEITDAEIENKLKEDEDE